MDYMLFPRILALAERAWHKAEWEQITSEPIMQWEIFKNKVGYCEFPRLDRMGIMYRVPPPGLRYGTRVKSGKFGHQVNSDTHLQTV